MSFESRLLEDSDLFELASAVDEELMEDLMSGKLSKAHLESVGSRIISTESGRRRLALLLAIREFAAKRQRSAARERAGDSPAAAGGTLFEALYAFFTNPLKLAPALMLVAATLVAIPVYRGYSQLESETETLRHQISSLEKQIPSRPAVKMTFTVRPTVRSEAGTVTLSVPRGTPLVELWLEIPPIGGEYRARITSAGAVREIGGLAAQSSDLGSFVPLELELADLGNEASAIELHRKDRDEWLAAGSYTLRISRE